MGKKDDGEVAVKRKAKTPKPAEDGEPKKKKAKAAAADADSAAAADLRRSPRLAAAKDPKPPKRAASFELDETVTGKAVKGATAEIVDDAAKGTPLSEFDILAETTAILEKRGITTLFPIQAQTYEKVIKGKDIIGRAKTGQGKTLAFVLPIVQKLLLGDKGEKAQTPGRAPRVLCLLPTRELAKQVCTEFEIMMPKYTSLCIYGGAMYQPQESTLRRGVDVVVGTPGRIIDHLNRGNLKLNELRFLVLDEADEMLDIGFQDDIDKILEAATTQHPKPAKIQRLLWSATIPSWVQNTAKKYMTDPITVDIVGHEKQKTSTDITHLAVKCFLWSERPATLRDVLAVYGGPGVKTIIFAETKAEANELALNSGLSGVSQVLHGDIPQAQREVTMQAFRDSSFDILIATDVAARGLDVPDIRLVVQCQPPKVETYVHRSGRTGRAGKKGTCITFFSRKDEYKIDAIERSQGTRLARIGAPQPADIMKSSLRATMKRLNTVHDDVVPFFLEAAEQLLATREPVRTLATALALIGGHCEPPAGRSLISAMVGFTTLVFETQKEMWSTGLVWNIMRQTFPESFAEQVRGMTMCADKKSAVFDVPNELAADIDGATPPWGCSIKVCLEMPELAEQPSWGAPKGGGKDGGKGKGFGKGGGKDGGKGGGKSFGKDGVKGGGKSFGGGGKSFGGGKDGGGRGGGRGFGSDGGKGGRGGGRGSW